MHWLSKGVSQALLSLPMVMSAVGGKKGQLLMEKCWEGLRVWSFPIFSKMLSHNNNQNKKSSKAIWQATFC